MAKKFQHIGGAYGIAGKFLWPVEGTIDIRPSVDLPPTGGFGKDLEENFSFHELLSYRRAYAEVSGSPNEEPKDGRKVPAHNNLSLAVIEDFNLLHVIDVRKMVSRITTRYFEDEEEVEIVLSGTRYEGFRIFGHDIIVKLATEVFFDNPTPSKLKASCHEDPAFRQRYHKLSDGKDYAGAPGESVEITIVEEIIVPHPTREFSVHKNVIEIPHIGRLILGELIITPNTKSLNLLRWELGCPAGGDGSGGGGQGGGSPTT
jgi:hypothetical protein